MKAFLGGRRAGLVLLALLTGVSVAPGSWAAPAGIGCEGSMRVLLYNGEGPVVIEQPGRQRRFEAVRAGVRMDGGPSMAAWRSQESGPSRVRGMRVRGALEVLRTEQGLAVVNSVPLEEYVAGALHGEIPAAWNGEALRAQAVASRSYALHQRAANRARPYDVGAGTRSQVYAGSDAIPPALRAAVRDTRCEVLTHGGAPILAAFHSASGGRTASAREVWGRDLHYLVSQPVEDEDDSPDTYWRAALSSTTLGRALAAAGHEVGEVKGARVLERSASGRVSRIWLEGTRGTVTLPGRELRAALGESTLKSTLFELRARQTGLLFVGSGSGHGVGMSQWGARRMAERGAGYREILAKFYPGTRLERWKFEGVEGAPVGAIPVGQRRDGETREESRVVIRSEERQ